MDFSDMRLIALVLLNDDHKAFGKLVEKYQSDVRGLLIRLTNGDKALADDLAQDVFIRAYKYLKSFKATASFSTWLYRISYNVFIDNYKSQKQTENIDDYYNSICDENNDSGTEIDFQTALKVLGPNEKVVILLHYSKGYSHNEIAKITGMPLGSVKTNILKAKDKLRKYYNYEQKG
jgi:RNA polymerase sigma-70 factor (ECF subfamily)